MNRCLNACIAVAIALLATGCQAGERARPAAEASSRDAVPNPRPKQVVKLHGRVPPSLRVEFLVWYTMEDVKADGCRPRDVTGGFLPFLGDFTRVDTLESRYLNGNRYEAKLVVDKYLPGPCGWAFDRVIAVVVKDGKVGDSKFTTGTSSPVINNNTDGLFVPYCYRPDSHNCPVRQNADPVPVLLLCEFTSSPIEGEPDFFTCADHFPGINYKQTHLLDEGTSEVMLDLYDLHFDSSPISLTPPQSTEAAP